MTRRSSFASRLVVAVLAAATLVACGGGGGGRDSGQAAPSAEAGSNATRTVVDMTGRSVQIPADVKRVATNYPALNQAIFMLGDADRIVATSKDMRTGYPLFETMYPRLERIPVPFTAASANANVEELVSTRPDVVLLSAGSQGLLPKLAQLHVPALVFAAFKDPTALKAGMKLAGDVLGGDAVKRAAQFADYYDQNVKRVQQATASVPEADRPKVYYTAGNPLQTEGAGSIVTTWMDAAGGRNVAAQNGIKAPPVFATVSFEDVAKWNPDVIICRDPKTRTAILADSRWHDIAAVRNNRVVVSPMGVFIWSVRSAEAALQPLWAAKVLHPELVGDLDLRQEVKEFFREFYSYDLTDRQVDAVLNPTA